MAQLSFPRQAARTQRFTLGVPRTLTVSPDGARVVFLRSRSGTDRATLLWVADVGADAAAGVRERVVVDPLTLGAGDEQLSPEERARRERLREGAGGVVGYACDRDVRLAAFALSGELYVADLTAASAPRLLPISGSVFDPRPDPTGRHIAYVSDGALRVVGVDGANDRALPGQDAAEGVTWGLAEFIAAEEMNRLRGYWWAPDGAAVLAARVDTTPVPRWHLADPARPEQAPTEMAYPAAGTANAEVRLFLLPLAGAPIEISWDRDRHEYLAAVHWSAEGPPLLLVQSRDQRSTQVLSVAVATGRTEVLHTETDPVWIDLVPGLPCWSPSGDLVRSADLEISTALIVDDSPASGPLQLRGLIGAVDGELVFTASAADPTEVHVYRSSPEGPVPISAEPGVHAAAVGGPVTVLSSASPHWAGRRTRVLRDGRLIGEIASLAASPPLTPAPTLLRSGSREVRTAVLLPTDHSAGTALPVLLDPYGGPHAQRVLAARGAFNESQWWADQGFAVVVADGRGTPARGPEWEKAVAGDLAGPVLDDQIAALEAAAAEFPDLDLSRVGIRGWSFGGYLAALAVLRRPEVFHAGIAGAPVTDWALYDTHYTERYLGTPQNNPAAYARSSLITSGELAPDLRPAPGRPMPPLLLVHGLADDNVVAAHTLQLSSALLAAGRPHQVLPLTGVSHMTPQEVVAENLLLLQLDFLRTALAP